MTFAKLVGFNMTNRVKKFVPGDIVARDGNAVCVFVGEIDGEDHGKVVEGEREWEPLPLGSILARMGWEPETKSSLERWF